MLGLKLNHVCKKGPRSLINTVAMEELMFTCFWESLDVEGGMFWKQLCNINLCEFLDCEEEKYD